MKKYLGLIIAGGAVLCLILAIVFVSVTTYLINGATIWEDIGLFGTKKYKTEMTGFRYSEGGGMNGDYERTEVRRLDDGTVYVVSQKSDWYYAIPEVSQYIVSEQIFSEIEEIFYKNRMGKWEKRRESPIQVCDASTSSTRFYFGSESTGYSSTQLLPRKYGEIERSIFKTISSYCERGTKLPGLVVNPTDEYGSIKRYEDGILELDVYAYYDGYIYFNILNGTEEELDFSDSQAVITDEKGQVIATEQFNYLTVYGQYSTDESVKLPGFLEEGKYKLTLKDLEVEFEIK